MGRVLSVVLATVVMLGTIGLERASAQGTFQDEIANLRSPNVGTRVDAAKALGRSGRPEAIPALTQAMRDPEVKVRRETVRALRSFTSTDAIDGLLIGLADEEKHIRSESLTALLEIYVGAGNAEVDGPFSWILGSRRHTPGLDGMIPIDPQVSDAVEARLRDEESDIRHRAAYTLGVFGTPEAVDGLGEALFDSDDSVRLEAVDSLAKIGTDEAGEALRGALRSTDTEMVGAAIDALGEMQYKPAAPELVSIYDANTNKLGERALSALGRMGADEARGVFYYQMTSKDPERRRFAVEGLGRLQDPSLVSGLIKDFLREPDPSVQLAYCFALANLGQTEFVDRVALDLGDRKRHEQAHAYAVELGSPLLNQFVEYLSDPVPAVRSQMATVLMEIGDPAAIPYLEPLLADPNRDVADNANLAIARLRQGRMSASTSAVR